MSRRQTIEDILGPTPTVEDILGPEEHKSNVVVDAAKRLARETGVAGGQSIAGFGRLGEIVQRATMRGALALKGGELPPEIERAILESPAMPGTGKMLRGAGEFIAGAAREAYDTDSTRDNTLVAKLAQAAGSLPVAIASGPAAPLTVAAMMGEQGAEDARETLARRGITDPAEVQRAEDAAFLVNAPVGAVSEALLGVPKLLKGVRVMEGATTAGRIGRQVALGAAREGAQEGIEQLAQNIAARDIVGYDPRRARTEGVGESILLGALLGGPTGAAFQTAQELDARREHARFKEMLDTAQNIPESAKTLLLQQDQLLRGLRPAQMFPKGSSELRLPDGFERVETERGVFHYNPRQITPERIKQLSAEGRENEILGLGPVSKPEVEARAAATGEPVVSVTERAPDGTEIKTAVGTTGTAAAQAAAMEATKSPGSVVSVETPTQTITERLRAQQAEQEAKAREAIAREQLAREKRQQELAAKRLRFEETLAAADALIADPAADFPKLNGALTSLEAAVDDNSLGLTLEQREAALARIATIRPRAAAARAVFEAESEARVAAAKAAEDRRKAEAKAARRAEREALDAIERTGRDPREGNAIVDITKVPDEEFEELRNNLDAEGLDLPTWEREMERRIREQERGDDTAPNFTLLDVFTGANGARKWLGRTLRLRPAAAARADGDPLAGDLAALQESLPFSYFSKDGMSLDRAAEFLRGAGFTDLQTPADVLAALDRAARGEEIRPTIDPEESQVDFAAAARRAAPVTRGIPPEVMAKEVRPVRISRAGFDRPNKANRAALLDSLPEAGGVQVLNRDQGREITVSRSALRHSFAAANGPLAHATLGEARALVENAVRVGDTLETLPPEAVRLHRFVAAAQREDGIVPVRITVAERADGSLHTYDIQPLGHKKRLAPTAPSLSGRVRGQDQPVVTVADLLPEVKQEPDGTTSAAFATDRATETDAGRRVLSEAEVARQFQTLRATLGPIARQFDIQVGLVADLLAEEGYTREAEAIRSGRLGDIAAATAPRLAERVNALRAQRRFIVIAAEEARKGNAPGLLLHELAHPFFQSLPPSVRDVLRQMHAEETSTRTGPLYENGKLVTRIAVEPSQFPAARLRANPDLPVEEWFAERVRRLNEAWLAGRVVEEESVIRRLWRQLLDKLAQIFARVRGYRVDGDLFTDTFRDWLRTGNEANIAPAATAYAAGRAADFATAGRSVQTDTPEFRRWFGKSKVVDEHGRPRVVYHGTNADFNEFKVEFQRAGVQYRPGFFFAEDEATARLYGEKVMPVYLRAETGIVEKRRTGKPVDHIHDKERGIWIVFDPKQIKSAVNNRGTFDPDDPRIDFAATQGTFDFSEEQPAPTRLVVPRNRRLMKPITGPSGAKIIGYEWRSTIEDRFDRRDGGFVAKRVSDWGAAETSHGTGRQIVHIFYVQTPDGRVTTEGINSAQNILGISAPRLRTIASTAQAEQETRRQQEADTVKRYTAIAKPTAREAFNHYIERNTRGLDFSEAWALETRLLNMAVALEQDGKFVVLPRSDSEGSDTAVLRAHGWRELAGRPWASDVSFATNTEGPPDGGPPFLTREEFGDASDAQIRAEYQRIAKLLAAKKVKSVSLRTDLFRLQSHLKEEAERRGMEPLDVVAKRPLPAVKTGAELEQEQEAAKARETEAAKAVRHPAAVGEVDPGMAWAAAPTLTTEQLAEESKNIEAYLDENALDLSDIERANLQARRTALDAEAARRRAEETPAAAVEPAGEVRVPEVPADVVGTPVPGYVKPDPEAALIAEWRRGKGLRDEGRRTRNETAEDEGQAIMSRAKARLDLAFPGWEERVMPARRPAAPAQRRPSPARPDQIEQDDGRNLPPPPPEEPPERAPSDSDEPAPNRGRADEAFGHTAGSPTWAARTWEKIRAALVGIRGSIPELPAFPALAAKTDSFIREHGAHFYDNLRAFYRTLNSSNDYIQRTAEEKVAAIVSPLLDLGGRFDAAAYAKLQRRQAQARTFRAAGRPMPAGARAELQALQARLERHPYYLFNRLVFFMDLDWRRRNLKDGSGNPIRLPYDLNETELEAELAKLGAAIAASPHAQAIEEAFQRHTGLVREVADDLKARDLLAAEHLSNPFYFPHLTLQITRGGETVERELRPERVRVGTDEDFRGYLIEPVGSDKPIETDYVKAMYYHLVQVGAHNMKADAVRDFILPYEKMAEVKKRAQELSKQRGVPVDWNQAFHEEYAPRGYVMMTHSKENPYLALTIDRDKLAQRLGVVLTGDDLHKQLNELGLRGVKILPEDIKETLLTAGPEVWIVPARVAEALRGIESRSKRQDQPIEAALRAFNGWWKAWKLFMPQNHVRYEYGNVVADLEKIFSASPRTFRFIGQAAKEMRDFFNGGAPSDDLRAALRLGVINAITAAEMNQLQRVRAFEKFQTIGERVATQLKKRASSALYQPVTNLLGIGDLSSVELSALREGVTRYANFLANLDAIRNGARPDYAGAYWRDIEAMGDSRPGAGDKAFRQAAQISRATFGDYGDLSVSGQWLRDHFIPFYSWMEVNFKYHANLFRNLRDMVRADLPGGKGAAAAQAGRAIAAAVGGRTSWLAGKVLLRLAIPYAAVALWNAVGPHGVDDDELSEEDRRRFHIRIGHDKDGKALVIYGNTAFADVAKWFGGARFVEAFGDWLAGRTDFLTALDEWGSSLPGDLANNTIGSAGPVVKIPATVLTKRSFFPDVLDSKAIPDYDIRRAILSQTTDDFTADIIERGVNKDYVAPKDLGTWAQQLILQVRRRDPESWAFYSIKDKAAAFLEARTGQTRDSSYNAPDQQVLRNFRRAIYQGDVETASRMYLRLLDLGYTAERFASSIRAQEPLAALPKALRDDFVESLDETERQQLRRAYAYYTRMSAARGRERALFPSKAMGEKGAEVFRARPRTEQLTRIIESRDRFSDDEILRQADLELRRSLAPGH